MAVDDGAVERRKIFVNQLLLFGFLTGQTHPVGGQNSGQRVQEDLLYPQPRRYSTRMLTAGPAETIQNIILHIETTTGRDLLDRLSHMFDGDLQKPFCHLFRRSPII